MLVPQEGGRALDALLIMESDATIARLLVLDDDGYAVVVGAASPDKALARRVARGSAAVRTVLSDDVARSRAVPYAWLDRPRACIAAPNRDPHAGPRGALQRSLDARLRCRRGGILCAARGHRCGGCARLRAGLRSSGCRPCRTGSVGFC